MAIEYAGGTIVKTTLDGTVKENFISDLNSALVSAGWTSTTMGANDYYLTSELSPHGLRMKVRVNVAETNFAGVVAYGMDDVALGGGAMYIAAGSIFECVATRYNCFIWTNGIVAARPPGGVTAYASDVAFGVPFLPEPVRPLVVIAATNTSPIQITTSTNHGLTTGQSVFITEVGGNTAANGSFVITSTGATTFTLDGSTGNGAYTSSGFVGTTSRLSKCFYVNSSDGTGALPTNGFRSDPFQTLSTSGITSYSGVTLNEYSVFAPGMNTPLVQPAEYPWRNNRSVITEPYFKTLSQTQAQIYGAAVIRGTPVPSRDTVFSMDGHSWVILGTGGTNSAMAIAVN
jgi:hypothetical protein